MCEILYAIGVGPGDPDMLTLAAVRTLQDADVLCLPAADKRGCRAYQTAEKAVPEIGKKECVYLALPMTNDEKMLAQAHSQSYATVKKLLLRQKKVAFLTIGDPAIYAGAQYILQKASADGFPVRMISGVPSFCACAAALRISLCEKKEAVHILSGQDDIEAGLGLQGTKIIMKCGKNISEIKALLQKLEKKTSARIFAVQECGTAEEACFFGASAIPTNGKYMLTIIVKDQ